MYVGIFHLLKNRVGKKLVPKTEPLLCKGAFGIYQRYCVVIRRYKVRSSDYMHYITNCIITDDSSLKANSAFA